MTQPSSPEPITRHLGRRVAEHRSAAGMSQTDLAEKVSAHGLDWGRTTVAKLESGGRKAVTVQELFVLALVFDVPPVMLLADPRHVEQVPVTPEATTPAWDALAWLVGAATLDGRFGRTAPAAFYDAGWLVDQVLVLHDALRELEHHSRGVTGIALGGRGGRLTRDPDEVREELARRDRLSLEKIRDILRTLRRDEVPLPALPEWVRERAAELGIELEA